jgi:hypothetical protein
VRLRFFVCEEVLDVLRDVGAGALTLLDQLEPFQIFFRPAAIVFNHAAEGLWRKESPGA